MGSTIREIEEDHMGIGVLALRICYLLAGIWRLLMFSKQMSMGIKRLI